MAELPPDGDTSPSRREPRRIDWHSVLPVVTGLVGIAALGASVWVFSSTQRDITALATDVARLRLSLDLYARQAQPAEDGEALLEMANRLAILEEQWRSTPQPATASTLPELTAPAAASTDTGDCLPTGTRFMVAAGDSYPVCGTGAVVSIGSVDNGYISLGDGTVIAQGGNIVLPGTGCMIGVVPDEGAGLTGYAEIRVTC
jgi:hypothetical protein